MNETDSVRDEVDCIVHTGDDLLDALDFWLTAPTGTSLTLHIRGSILHYPDGPTEGQFHRLVSYASILTDEGSGVN